MDDRMDGSAEVAALTAEAEAQDLEERARPFRALYEHWERNQWSPLAIDYTEDRASFLALDDETRQGFTWIFAHRFHAEFKVATILAPFVMQAPTYETQVVLATQLADEYRHMNSVLRVYDEVLGISDIDEIRALADSNIDPIAATLYEALEDRAKPLETSADPGLFLKAVIAYHLIAEGVVARTAQTLATGQFARFGSYPGLIAGQRNVARDEARHIGFGVSFVRWRMAENRAQATAAVEEVVENFTELAAGLLQTALSADMDSQVLSGYGVDAQAFYAEAMRFWHLRLRSIGYLDDE
jgi:ribonucleotide reductase beta subunit family protein with ferritin-like domain